MNCGSWVRSPPRTTIARVLPAVRPSPFPRHRDVRQSGALHARRALSGRARHVGGMQEAAGVRLVGIFVPWQAVALTLAVVVALAGLATIRWVGGGSSTVHLAATGESTTTTTALDAPTTTAAAETTTTTAAATTTTRAVVVPTPKPTAPPSTTTTVPAPATCAVIRSAVSGSVTSSWVASPTNPGTWDRHITVTVTNPMNQPVVLGYIATMSSAAAYVFQLTETDGRRLGVRHRRERLQLCRGPHPAGFQPAARHAVQRRVQPGLGSRPVLPGRS